MKRKIWLTTAIFLALLIVVPTLTTAHERGHRGPSDERPRHLRVLDDGDLEELLEAMATLEVRLGEDFGIVLEDVLDDALEVLDDPRFENSIERALEDALAMFEDGTFERDLERALENLMHGLESIDTHHGDGHWRVRDVRRHRDRDADRREVLEQRLEDLQREIQRIERRIEVLDKSDQQGRRG